MSGYENTPKRHVRSAQREIAILRLLYLDFAIRGVRLGPIHGSGRKGAVGRGRRALLPLFSEEGEGSEHRPDRGSPQLQQHEPFLVVERAFASGPGVRVSRGRGLRQKEVRQQYCGWRRARPRGEKGGDGRLCRDPFPTRRS